MNPRHRIRAGFTLIEAMVALTITSLAGSVLLLAIESSLETTTDAVDRTIAEGLAQQLLDEITSKRYMEPGTSAISTTFGCTSTEAQGSGRERYNDSDDFHRFSAHPAEGLWGEPLGTGDDLGDERHENFRVPDGFFQNWRQRVEVYFVNATNQSQRLTVGTSYYRAAEVHIEYIDADGAVKPLASRRRVYAYIPPPT